MHTSIVVAHIVFAVAALFCAPLAVRFPNGTVRHRRIGRVYVASWIIFGSTGFYLGAIHPSISPFEVLNVLGAGFVLAALFAIWRQEKIGPNWKRRHYRMMLISYAFVAVATVNQVLSQAGLEYPFAVFIALALTPFLVLPKVIQRLDKKFGFTHRD